MKSNKAWHNTFYSNLADATCVTSVVLFNCSVSRFLSQCSRERSKIFSIPYDGIYYLELRKSYVFKMFLFRVCNSTFYQ